MIKHLTLLLPTMTNAATNAGTNMSQAQAQFAPTAFTTCHASHRQPDKHASNQHTHMKVDWWEEHHCKGELLEDIVAQAYHEEPVKKK